MELFNEMQTWIAAFPEQLMEGEKQFSLWKAEPKHPYDKLLWVGMGGSAFAANFLQDLIQHQIPIFVLRHYELPAWVDEKTLVVLSSYSGNTEEVLIAGEKLLEQKRNDFIIITSGGQLQQWQSYSDYPILSLPKGYVPRAAVGYAIAAGCIILQRFWNIALPNFYKIAKTLKRLNISFIAKNFLEKELFLYIDEHLPLYVYVPYNLNAIGLRFKQQVNENVKCHLSFAVLPEMNHNELVGWQRDKGIVWFLTSRFAHERIKKRIAITAELLLQCGSIANLAIFQPPDTLTREEELFFYLHLVDWFSLHWAQWEQVPPTPIAFIDYLKMKLSQ